MEHMKHKPACLSLPVHLPICYIINKSRHFNHIIYMWQILNWIRKDLNQLFKIEASNFSIYLNMP